MSDQRRRIGWLTGANANLLGILGDLVSSDGIQTMRVPLGTPGQVLTVDLTAECGIAWADGGGGGSLTFSDGVTRTADNVTNDLVTGTAVATVDIVSTGDIGITNSGASDINITAARDEIHTVGRRFEVTAAGATGVGVSASAGPLALDSSGNMDLTTTAGFLTLTSGVQLNLNANGGHMHLNSANSILLDAANTVGVTSVGKTSLNTTGGAGSGADIQIDAGDTLRLNTVNTTRPIKFFDGAGAAQQTVADPAGGGVVDAECRTQLVELLDAMRLWGLLS